MTVYVTVRGKNANVRVLCCANVHNNSGILCHSGPRVRSITLRADQEIPGNLLNGRNCLEIRRDCRNVRNSPFRTLDGSCNNLVRGREGFGSIERAFKRILPPRFGDGKCDVTVRIVLYQLLKHNYISGAYIKKKNKQTQYWPLDGTTYSRLVFAAKKQRTKTPADGSLHQSFHQPALRRCHGSTGAKRRQQSTFDAGRTVPRPRPDARTCSGRRQRG